MSTSSRLQIVSFESESDPFKVPKSISFCFFARDPHVKYCFVQTSFRTVSSPSLFRSLVWMLLWMEKFLSTSQLEGRTAKSLMAIKWSFPVLFSPFTVLHQPNGSSVLYAHKLWCLNSVLSNVVKELCNDFHKFFWFISKWLGINFKEVRGNHCLGRCQIAFRFVAVIRVQQICQTGVIVHHGLESFLKMFKKQFFWGGAKV